MNDTFEVETINADGDERRTTHTDVNAAVFQYTDLARALDHGDVGYTSVALHNITQGVTIANHQIELPAAAPVRASI